MADAEQMQFVCPNPMRGPVGMNKEGRPAARCQSNVALRRHLVAEFDDASLTKCDQAKLASALGELAPLLMAVDSAARASTRGTAWTR